MFGLKGKRKKTYVTVHYEQGNKLQEYLIGEIPIKEEIIIAKSIQFFDDPEPCYIHRGAVVVRLNEEILNEVEQYIGQTQIAVSNITKEILEYIDLQEVEAFEVCRR